MCRGFNMVSNKIFKEIRWCFIYLGQAWIFLLNNFVCCLAFWFLDVHLFLGVEVDADQELPSVSSFWHHMTSMIHDWNWVKKILWIFEDHLLVSVNIISFQSLFTTCFSYEYTLNWIETLLYLQGISMYKSYKWKMDEAQETTSVYFSNYLWSFV